MTPLPGVHITTIQPPQEYSRWQLDLAARVADGLARGKFVLAELPRR